MYGLLNYKEKIFSGLNSLSYRGALKLSFFVIPERFPLRGRKKQEGVRLRLTFHPFL